MDLTRKTIFLVNDDITNLMIGKNALSDIYNVFTLNSGSLLLEMLEDLSPDLILLDVNMPEMSGLEAIARIKANERTAQIPVIFLTARSDEEAELQGLSLGAIDYIVKPFLAPLLLKRIEVHLLVESQKRKLLHFNDNLMMMVEDKTQTVVALKNAILKTMAELLEYRDDVTGSHIERTQRYIKLLFESMNSRGVYVSEVAALDKNLVLQSCQLHDIGKISIRDAILLKPGKLTPEEFELMKTHTVFGEEVILKLKNSTMDSDFLEYARAFAISHHEKWGGSCYPYGVTGANIPLLGRIMAIADVYDALVTDRPYKAAFSHEKAVQIIMEGKGTHFDPELIDLFEKISPEFGKIAAEVRGNDDWRKMDSVGIWFACRVCCCSTFRQPAFSVKNFDGSVYGYA
ncbi:MAG: response regulator [Defluviitaleaceae bacterium]|nr:response regulator [Defluviitaleaceae bacterium]